MLHTASSTMSLPLPDLREKLDEVTHDVVGAATGLWHVHGPSSAGKSTLLRELAPRLSGRGVVPVLVTPPPGQLDTGGVALVEFGAALRRAGLIDTAFEAAITAQKGWTEKVEHVRGWLEDANVRERVVLLCDEPNSWPAARGDEIPLGEHARELAGLLVDARCRRVVAGRLEHSRATRIRLTLRSDAGWLADEDLWGVELAPAAERARKTLGTSLEERSPLDVRLLVALAARGDVSGYADMWRRGLATDLWAKLGHNEMGRKTQRVWARLALLRMPFHERLLTLAKVGELDALHRAIVERCLLFRQGEQLVMHEMLRVDARQGNALDPNAARTAHEAFAGAYTERFTDAAATTDVGASLREEMEAYHHATCAGDVGTRRAFFSDQLDALGRALSRKAVGWPRNPRPPQASVTPAITVFTEALRWDDDDDYAHHYLAYNRDLVAEPPQETEVHFRRAIELAPGRVWWRARFITFLITLARYGAARQEWDAARDALGLPDAGAPSLYEDLHVWVARLLIHRGQTEFAQTVLSDVPPEVLEEHAGIRAMHARLRALVEARERGAFAPGRYLDGPDWWHKGPFLIPPRLLDGRARQAWMAGRVDEVHDKVLELRVARITRGATAPEIGALSLEFSRFDRMCLDGEAADLAAGRFVELGKYAKAGKKAELVARVHPAGAWDTRDLPPLFPDPTRYARRS